MTMPARGIQYGEDAALPLGTSYSPTEPAAPRKLERPRLMSRPSAPVEIRSISAEELSVAEMTRELAGSCPLWYGFVVLLPMLHTGLSPASC